VSTNSGTVHFTESGFLHVGTLLVGILYFQLNQIFVAASPRRFILIYLSKLAA
jgi:hypothetical protein